MSKTAPPSPEGLEPKDLEFAKDAVETSTSSKPSSVRLGDSEGGVWASGGAIDNYKPIPEYEGAHRYDPTFEWDENEEKRLVRRVRNIQRTRLLSGLYLFGSVVC